MLQVERLCLITPVIWRIPLGMKAEDWVSNFTAQTQGHLLTHIGTQRVGYRSLTGIELQTPEFWKNKIVGAHLADAYQRFNDYVLFYLLVDILPSLFQDLLSGGRYELGQSIDALIQQLTSNMPWSKVVGKWPKYAQILSVRPLIETLQDESYLNKATRIAKQFREVLNDRSIYVPHLLFDTLLFPAVAPMGPESGMVAVDIGQNPRHPIKPHDFLIPKTTLDVVDYLGAFHIIQDFVNRLKALPFLSETLEFYVERIRESSASAKSRKHGNRRGRNRGSEHVSSAYEYMFLEDRIKSSLERDSINQSMSALLQHLAHNEVRRAKQLRLSQSMDETVPAEIVSIRVIDELLKEFHSRQSGVTRTERLLRNRESELADYLRDVAVADSTRANLKLQRSVRLLTIVAIAFAFLSLIASFLADEHKASLAKRLGAWLTQLWS